MRVRKGVAALRSLAVAPLPSLIKQSYVPELANVPSARTKLKLKVSAARTMRPVAVMCKQQRRFHLGGPSSLFLLQVGLQLCAATF